MFNLSVMYREGEGVEDDRDKQRALLEKAAIAFAGHPKARYNLGIYEAEYGRNDRAVKHWIIAANMGHDESLEALKNMYRDGLVRKKDLASALLGYQAAVDARESPQRSEAEQVLIEKQS